jgi:hypothetical protein
MGCIVAKQWMFLCSVYTPKMAKTSKVFCRGEGIGIFPKGVGRSPCKVVERIEKYLTLNLTKPSDILKGVLSILNTFKRIAFKIRHYAGVPLLPPRPKMVEFPSDNWTLAMGFFSGLCWTLEKPSCRRAGFLAGIGLGGMNPSTGGMKITLGCISELITTFKWM